MELASSTHESVRSTDCQWVQLLGHDELDLIYPVPFLVGFGAYGVLGHVVVVFTSL